MTRTSAISAPTNRQAIWCSTAATSVTDVLLTNLPTNRSVPRGTEAHVGVRSPRSRRGIRSRVLSMAWKRSVDSSRAGPEIQPRRLTREAHVNS
jgi:hypothetical protein